MDQHHYVTITILLQHKNREIKTMHLTTHFVTRRDQVRSEVISTLIIANCITPCSFDDCVGAFLIKIQPKMFIFSMLWIVILNMNPIVFCSCKIDSK